MNSKTKLHNKKIDSLRINNQFIIIFFAIIVLAIFLRFPFLSTFPPAMLQDEVGLGYSAISIAETGKDEWGNTYPLIFKSFGDYKPPAFIYATALLYKIIGWHQILPRITSAISGIIVVIAGSLWIRKVTKSNKLGLIAGVLFAISPWTIHLSRMALESNLGLAFFLLGLLFMSYAEESRLKLITSAMFFGLSTYAYHSYRYIVILLLFAFILSTITLNTKKIKKHFSLLKTVSLLLAISTVISIPSIFAKGSMGRLSQTFLLTSDRHISLYQHYENSCHNTFIEINPKLTIICRLQYNKYSRAIVMIVDSYIKHLSPGFYFFSGDSDAGRNPTHEGGFFAV